MYAGYLLWRGVIATCHLDDQSGLCEALHLASARHDHLVAYPIPSHDGATGLDERLVHWGWYFALPERALPGVFAPRAETRSPHDIGQDGIADEWRQKLPGLTRTLWPDWVQRLVETTLEKGALSPHPVYECEPSSIVSGRVVLLGDAARLASPITAAGARMAMEDALALGHCLLDASSVEEALRAYEDRRLSTGRAIVRDGKTWGRRFRET